MSDWRTLADIRREYGNLELTDDAKIENPFLLFQYWFEEALHTEKQDPTAMVLSTVDEKNHPDSRVVLLKGLLDETFVFYTNYDSNKGIQLNETPYAALNFYWPTTARQIRIRGNVKQTTATQSDEYFSSRPRLSQISAIASKQSRTIDTRDQLEQALNQQLEKHAEKPIVRPVNWGGYYVIPEEMEFWQGRDNRLHDRIQYARQNNVWHSQRLSP